MEGFARRTYEKAMHTEFVLNREKDEQKIVCRRKESLVFGRNEETD